MPSSMLVSQLVSSSIGNGGRRRRWSRKKKNVFGSRVRRTCGAAMWANSVSAMRSFSQRSESPSTRRKRTERCQRSPGHVRTCIDAEPSRSTTMSTPPVRTSDATTPGCARATNSRAVATIRRARRAFRRTGSARGRAPGASRPGGARRGRARSPAGRGGRSIAGTTSSQRSRGPPRRGPGRNDRRILLRISERAADLGACLFLSTSYLLIRVVNRIVDWLLTNCHAPLARSNARAQLGATSRGLWCRGSRSESGTD